MAVRALEVVPGLVAEGDCFELEDHTRQVVEPCVLTAVRICAHLVNPGLAFPSADKMLYGCPWARTAVVDAGSEKDMTTTPLSTNLTGADEEIVAVDQGGLGSGLVLRL